MARKLGVGIVGCGNISAAYFSLAPLFKGIEVTACADINPAAAKARAKEFGVRAEATVEDLLKAKDVDIVVNLTVPAVHYAISRQALDAGKHVYSEKPFVLDVKEGLDLKKRADKQGLRVGSAPDTFLGGAHQQARHLVDSGAVGRITGGTCHVMSHGMEHWHPNPDFFFLPGAGPILDLGPYYITNLIQLIGPVKRVTALTSTPQQGAHHRQRPAAWREGAGEDADDHPRAHGIRERRGGDFQRQLGRLAARPLADGTLRRGRHAARARPQLLRRRSRHDASRTSR